MLECTIHEIYKLNINECGNMQLYSSDYHKETQVVTATTLPGLSSLGKLITKQWKITCMLTVSLHIINDVT